MRVILFFLLALLTAPAVAQHKVQYDLKAQPAEVKVGGDFDVTLTVEDLRPSGHYSANGEERELIRGVFSAYCDLNFDKTLAAVPVTAGVTASRAALEYRSAFAWAYPFLNDRRAFDSPTGITRAGAFSAQWGGLEPGPHDVFRVKLRAKKPGTLIIQVNTKSLRAPLDDTLLMGNLLAVPSEQSDVSPAEILLGRAMVIITP